MSDPFIAEIKIFAGNFAPRGWAFCNGQLLPIAQNTALFSLIGTTYGGDGRTTTALPDLKARAPMHPGNGPGLTSRRLGERVGVTTVTLNTSQMANHNHTLRGSSDSADLNAPAADRSLARSTGGAAYQQNTTANLVPLAPQAVSDVGSGGAHNNIQPRLGLNFIIALAGVFPSRN